MLLSLKVPIKVFTFRILYVFILIVDRYFQCDNSTDDNDNILFYQNVQIEIIIYNSLENQIINWSGDYY